MSKQRNMSSTQRKPDIIVLGAGVIGLQTALSLIETNLYNITIIAEHFPSSSSSSSIEYTSPWAGGHWRSHASSAAEDEELRQWDAETYEHWKRLLKDAEEEEDESGKRRTKEEIERKIGLGIRDSVMHWSHETEETKGGDGSGLWWKDVVSGFGILTTEELKGIRVMGGATGPEFQPREEPVIFGAKYDSVCINVPVYLSYLLERATSLGAQIIHARVATNAGLEGVIQDINCIFNAHLQPSMESAPHHPKSQIRAVVLATGLLSRSFLPPEEASLLYPIRGQTILVRGEASKAITHIFSSPDELSYVIPRPGSGTTILGGCKQVENWDEGEDTALTSRILERSRLLCPQLMWVDDEDTKGKGSFEVMSVQVGRRPGRKTGPRVEMEKEEIVGVKVIYAYGHAGAGYQNSVGSARKVVSLVAGGDMHFR